MPDPRFFRRSGPFRLEELAARAGAAIAPGADGKRLIQDIALLETAGGGDIIYVAEQRYLPALATSHCGACVTSAVFAHAAPVGCAVIIARDPRSAFADIAAAFYPDSAHETSGADGVAAEARIGPDVTIHPRAVVEAGAEIGAGSVIGANAMIGSGVVIGAGCRIAANVTLTHCLLGERVIIHPGVQIGQDGFGFVSGPRGHRKIPQLGRVQIGDDVEIGANCTIDRGTADDTVIGAGTKIDNLVQIGHNVYIGKGCIIVAQVGISGSCRIGDGVVIGGQAGFADHVHVADRAQIAAKSGVMRDVGPGEVVMGYPAKPIRQFWRDIAALSRLTRRDK